MESGVAWGYRVVMKLNANIGFIATDWRKFDEEYIWTPTNIRYGSAYRFTGSVSLSIADRLIDYAGYVPAGASGGDPMVIENASGSGVRSKIKGTRITDDEYNGWGLSLGVNRGDNIMRVYPYGTVVTDLNNLPTGDLGDTFEWTFIEDTSITMTMRFRMNIGGKLQKETYPSRLMRDDASGKLRRFANWGEVSASPGLDGFGLGLNPDLSFGTLPGINAISLESGFVNPTGASLTASGSVYLGL